jgi:hypothetical protein
MPRRGIGELSLDYYYICHWIYFEGSQLPRTEKEPLPDVASSNPWAVESIPEAMDGTAKPAAEDFYPICPKGTITTIISVAIPKSASVRFGCYNVVRFIRCWCRFFFHTSRWGRLLVCSCHHLELFVGVHKVDWKSGNRRGLASSVVKLSAAALMDDVRPGCRPT